MICNCCDDCCMMLVLMKKIGAKCTAAPSRYRVRIGHARERAPAGEDESGSPSVDS